MLSFVLLAIGGIVGGLLSGMLGIGGGIIVVPLLIYLLPLMDVPLPLVVPMAVGTSLATIVVTTASSAFAHHKNDAIDWSWVRLIIPLLIVGGVIGGYIGASIDPLLLQRIFAIMLLLLAARMIWKVQPRAQDLRIRRTPVRICSALIGMISALIGIGGGALVVPMLHYYQVIMRNAVAIAAVCSVVLALVGTITYAWVGRTGVDIPGAVGFVYLPAWLGIGIFSVLCAPLGAMLAHRLPVRYLQRAFAILLIAVSCHLFLTT